MKYHHFILATAATLLTTACITTNPKVTASDVEKYKSPQDYLEDRLAQGAFGFTQKHVLDDGTIVYKANYTSMNTRYIRKPVEDAKGYCTLNNGNWSIISTIGFNMQGMEAVGKYVGEIERVGFQRGLPNNVIAMAKQQAIQDGQAAYNNSGMREAQGIINNAKNSGHLGVYTCSMSTGSWMATIRPVSSILADQRNKLTTHKLILHVSIHQ